MALAQTQVEARKGSSAKTPAGPQLRGNAASLAAASVLMLTFMGATLPTPLYVIYRDELHFSQITLTLIYAVYFGGALATAFFLGRLSDETGRRVAIFAAVALSMIATVVFIFADSLPMLFLARLMSGLGIPLAAGAGTAWVAELCEGRCAAASLSAGATLAGLGLGPLVAGILAEYAPAPLILPFLLLLLLGIVAAAIAWHLPETVKRPVRAWSKLSLRPRVGVPRAIVPAFLAPAITAFATFSLLGFYSALAPSLLQQVLHVESHAIGGAVVFELYAVATLVLALTQWVDARAAMLWGLVLLIPALALLVLANEAPSLPILLTGAGLGGAAAALGYRGSLQLVNSIAPDDRRAEIVSTYLIFCYAGVSLPVIGIGFLAAAETPVIADESFAVVIAAFALAAIFVDFRSRRPRART
ncbi:MAG TPA: MFS transporter [Rhizobiales bacterium]|jgi:MFS family permease|nr:MFS transporter [Hyphomicrobiales bacterium]